MTYSTSIPLSDRGGALDCASLLYSNFVAGYHPRPVSYGAFAGANRSKFRFVQRAVSLGWKRRPGTAVVGPVAWALERMDRGRGMTAVPTATGGLSGRHL